MFKKSILTGIGCNHLNPPLLSKMQSSQSGPAPSTPTTPSHKPLQSQPVAAPRPRRNLSDRGTPRSSKLQEVFSAGDQGQDEDEEDNGDEMEVDKMDVDEQK